MSGSIMSGGGVDASIPLQAGKGQAQVNPLESTQHLIGALQGINQLKLFPGQMTLQQQAIQGGAATVAKHLSQVGASMMMPVFANPNFTMSDLTHGAGAAEGAGGSSHGVMAIVGAIPFAPNTPEWRTAVKQGVASLAQTNPEAAVAQIAGSPSTQSVGNRIIAGVTAPATAGGGFSGATSTPTTLTPGEAAQRVPGPPGVKGQPTTVPLGAPQVTPNSISQLNLGTGRMRDTLPAGLQNPNAPAPVGVPIQGQMEVGMGPGQTNAMLATGTDAAARFRDISMEGVQARDQTAVLANMQNDLAKFTPGPGADYSLALKKAVQVAAPSSLLHFNVPFQESVSAQESFRKLMNQLADAQGAGSDARLHVNQGANPSDTLSPGGSDFIIRQLQGNSDYKMARARLAANYPDQANVRGFEATIGAQLDPRYFQYNRLTADQKPEYLAGIKDAAERSAFKRGYGNAQRAGYLGFDNGR